MFHSHLLHQDALIHFKNILTDVKLFQPLGLLLYVIELIEKPVFYPNVKFRSQFKTS